MKCKYSIKCVYHSLYCIVYTLIYQAPEVKSIFFIFLKCHGIKVYLHDRRSNPARCMIRHFNILFTIQTATTITAHVQNADDPCYCISYRERVPSPIEKEYVFN